ncbi:MAG: RNA-binding protein [Hyphomicrobiales bacterium]|nr:RNA-binding protein [Hyphomicrobiales bacterium]
MSRPSREKPAPGGASDAPVVRLRLDKWLWFARVVKTRTTAARLVTDGHVRINGTRIENAAKAIGGGDVLTIALERDVRVLKVLAPGTRRGPFEEARLLYEDLTPPAPPRDEPVAGAQPARDRGAGRPTKRDRRSVARWFGGD